MDCKQFRDALDCYVDGELSARASAAADAHRRDCPSCAAAADHIVRLKGAVKHTVDAAALPATLESRIGTRCR